MTGYNSSDFIRRYTLSEFSMKQNLDDKWDQICLKAIEENDKNFILRNQSDGTDMSNEDSLKLAHCRLCEKIPVNNAHRYCVGCPYHTKYLIPKRS